jgi:glycolate oxidase
MTFKNPGLLRQLKRLLPGEIILEPATLAKYAGDKWFATHEPDAVALPRSAKSVATLLRFASKNKIPVTPRGVAHGYAGGYVPLNARN